MSADRVDVCRCLLCLPGHCTLSLVGGGAVFAHGAKAKLLESCSSDMKTTRQKLWHLLGAALCALVCAKTWKQATTSDNICAQG